MYSASFLAQEFQFGPNEPRTTAPNQLRLSLATNSKRA
jgi:hypothetical protein